MDYKTLVMAYIAGSGPIIIRDEDIEFVKGLDIHRYNNSKKGCIILSLSKPEDIVQTKNTDDATDNKQSTLIKCKCGGTFREAVMCDNCYEAEFGDGI